jgi:FkbM family methyltransferase
MKIKKKLYYQYLKYMKKNYKIGKINIKTPPQYLLAKYQDQFKLYDQFLPFLCGNMNQTGAIIDIGANIGDTTIAILQRCNNQIISIEASDYFFKYLENNIDQLDNENRKRITIVKKLVGTGTLNGFLNDPTHGTASLQINNSAENQFFKLDEIINQNDSISLIKVDTDGYDFDVILSAKEIILKHSPILFWENEIIDEFQINGFAKLYQFLHENGYNQIVIFDNFGNIISEETDFHTLTNINSYLLSMRQFNCTRTFYYVDVLASNSDQVNISNLILKYKSERIFN